MTEKKTILFRSFESFGYAIITFSYNYLSSPVDFQGHIPQKLLPNIAVSYLNMHCCVVQAWRTLLVYTAKNLTSFGSYELIKTQIASIFGKKLKFINSFSLSIFFLAVRPK